MIKFAVTQLDFGIFNYFSLSDHLVHAIAVCADVASLGMIITVLGLFFPILYCILCIYFYQDKQLVSYLFILAF